MTGTDNGAERAGNCEDPPPQSAPPTGRPLLALPEVGGAVDQFVTWAVDRRARSKSRIYAAVETFVPPEGIEGVIVEVAGESIPSPVMHLTYSMTYDPEDVRNTNLEAFRVLVEEAAEQRVRSLESAYEDHIEQSAAVVGNSVSVSRDELTWDWLLDMFEKVEWQEGADRQLSPPRPTASMGLPRPTEAQNERYQQIWKAKQDEHMARRRGRRVR